MTVRKQETQKLVVRYQAAFEDAVGIFRDDREFDTPKEAVKLVEELNQMEVNRMPAGKAPDTAWFVLRVASRASVFKRFQLPDQTSPLPTRSTEQVKNTARNSARRKIVIQRKKAS